MADESPHGLEPERRAGHRRVQRAPNTLEIEQQPLTG